VRVSAADEVVKSVGVAIERIVADGTEVTVLEEVGPRPEFCADVHPETIKLAAIRTTITTRIVITPAYYCALLHLNTLP
jgi:hypothetical protein